MIDPHYRARTDKIHTGGSITLRHHSRMHHISLGRDNAYTPVTVLIADLQVRILHRDAGAPIRELTLDPTHDYQPRGLPPGPSERARK